MDTTHQHVQNEELNPTAGQQEYVKPQLEPLEDYEALTLGFTTI
ncbi:MAG: hypothetical protein U5L04_11675 [Trueperaceae bacterium]|nr:hypothetical protein [Trueperaceae bacterium]